jgi:hypothetical protein
MMSFEISLAVFLTVFSGAFFPITDFAAVAYGFIVIAASRLLPALSGCSGYIARLMRLG